MAGAFSPLCAHFQNRAATHSMSQPVHVPALRLNCRSSTCPVASIGGVVRVAAGFCRSLCLMNTQAPGEQQLLA
jgi:hypothetical protein